METPDYYEGDEPDMPEESAESTDTKDDGGMATTIPRDFFGKECKVGDVDKVRITKILEDGYIVEPVGESDDVDEPEAVDSASEEAEEDDPLMG